MKIAKGNPFARSRKLHGHLPTLTLAVSLVAVFVIKYITVSCHRDMGCDIANYLSTMHTVFGDDPNGLGLLRPPLIALPLKALTVIFGDFTGVKLLGVVLAVSIGAPFYLLAKRVSHPWIAAAMTIVFVLTPAYSDMLSWGYITMTGLLFTLLTLYFFIQVIDSPSKLNVVLTGVFASMIVGFHQLSLAFFVPLFLLVLVAVFFLNRRESRRRCAPALAAIAIGILLSIPYALLYLKLLRMQPSMPQSSAFSITPHYVPWIVSMILSLPLVAIALRWIWHRQKTTAIVIALLFAYSSVLLLFFLPSPFAELNRRAHYFLYPAIWLLASALLSYLWTLRFTLSQGLRRRVLAPAIVILIAALVCSTLITSQLTLRDRLRTFGYLDDSRWDSVSWIRDHVPDEASVVVYPEALGWWIEAEAMRKAISVTDRDSVPLEPLRQRSLLAELVLSRNQGLENGNLRLATPYPYSGTPGSPAFAVCAAGFYHDLLIFDESHTYVESTSSGSTALASLPRQMTVTGGGDGKTMNTSYEAEDVQVLQTVDLQRGSQAAVVRYDISGNGAAITRLDLSLFFGFQPTSLSVDRDQGHVEVMQELQTSTDFVAVTTGIDIVADGASLDRMAYDQDGCLDISFALDGNGAAITFTLTVIDPELHSDSDVEHYQVPNIIEENSIVYIAVDFEPNLDIAGALPWGVQEWLGECPYYELVYPEGSGSDDVRVYRILSSTLS